MKKTLLATACACAVINAAAADVLTADKTVDQNDTTRLMQLSEVVVVGMPKENARLNQQTLASTSFSQTDMQAAGITSIKSLSMQVPNLFIPTYGSKLTTSAYIRGVGSRINTPAIGLYVDNVPFVNKSAFDFNFSDIERIDVLRGPQGTLYGRNTMGGLIRLFTKSPMNYQGTDLRIGASTYNTYKASATHYHRLSDKFAFSGGVFYEHQGGFFKNVAQNNKRVDGGDEYGARLRAIYLPADATKIDFSASYEHLDQGAYPYQYMGTLNGPETNPEYVGKVAYNSPGNYKRHLLNTGMNIEHQASRFVFNSVTGFQFLKDDMNMDQDYSPLSVFVLNQKQNSKTLSQEFALKSKPGSRWEWTTGWSGFYQWMKTDGPVTFLADGISGMIEDNVNSVFERLQASNPKMPDMALDITDNEFVIGGRFNTPTANTAFFHQSTFNNFLAQGLSLTLGARMEYEKAWMDYASGTDIKFDFNIPMLEHMPGMAGVVANMKGMTISPAFNGSLKHDNWEFLPKMALKYDFNTQNNIYASVSKGYRSGGYNIQMFSDLIETRMSADMMAMINEKSGGMIDKMAGGMMGNLGAGSGNENVDASVYYRPERSWNYEVGTHLASADNRLQGSFTMFMVNTTDQQIARFSRNGLGRYTVNAGESRSRGVEASFKALVGRGTSLYGNYGFTHATFKDYAVSEEVNYKGNAVPFVPKHTFTVGALQAFDLNHAAWFERLTINADYRGAGRIYWNEENSASQSFYGTLNARVGLQKGGVQVDVWAHNVLNQDYAAFYFESLGKAYRQKGTPFQAGIDVRLKF